MSTQIPRGATVWVLIDRNNEGANVRVFATQEAARKVIDGFLAHEPKERVWTYKGDISGCGAGFEWVSDGLLQLILAEQLVRW